MFKKTQAELRRLERGIEIPIDLPADEHGHFDRQCPLEDCRELFKVHLDDWKTKVRQEVVFCPICRHEADATCWNTPEQDEHIRSLGMAFLSETLNRALQGDARRFTDSFRGNRFVRAAVTFKAGPRQVVVPVTAAEAMELRVSCETCGCRYASIGSAFFCPSCGHNSAQSTFGHALSTVRTTLEKLGSIKAVLADSAGKDAARNAERDILEQSLQRLVSSLQRYAEATFASLPNAGQFKPRKNLFQNLSEASELWEKATGDRYEDFVTDSEMADLRRLFQQRHLLAHKEGVVDAEYVEKTGDATFGVGQRLVVKDATVLRLADLIEKLAAGLCRVKSAPS